MCKTIFYIICRFSVVLLCCSARGLAKNASCSLQSWTSEDQICFLVINDLQIYDRLTIWESTYKIQITTDVRFEDGKVENLPTEIFTSFKNIEKLSFERTGLKSLRAGSFKNSGKLKAFMSIGNQLQNLPDRVFTGAEGLDRILIQKNLLEVIADDAFEGLSSLTHLDLEDNRIVQMSDKVFQPLEDLSTLVLTNNKIVTLNAEVFKYNKQLKNLYLGDNQINVIDPNLFCWNKRITMIGFKNNICADREYVVGSNIFHVEFSQCYDNFFSSNSFLSRNKTRFEHYQCYLDNMDDHNKFIYQHLFDSLHDNGHSNENDPTFNAISKLQHRQSLLIAGFCFIILVMSCYIVYMHFNIRRMIGYGYSSKMLDLQELVNEN